MVGLMVTIAATLQKSNSLYTALWEEYKKNNNSQTDYSAFQRHTDCWYLPPYPGIVRPIILGVLIAIIIGIFVRASLLVITELDLFKPLTSNEVDFLRRHIFISAYIFGALVIAGCLYFIVKIVKGNCSPQSSCRSCGTLKR